MLKTGGIVLKYKFWQFLTPVFLVFVRNPGYTYINREVQFILGSLALK
jgi:hypothetical protein